MKSALTIAVTDETGNPYRDEFRVWIFNHVAMKFYSGGDLDNAKDFHVLREIPPGRLTTILKPARGYRQVRREVTLRPGTNLSVEFRLEPDRRRAVFSEFGDLPEFVRRILNRSKEHFEEPSGLAVYNQLSAKPRAGLLNLLAKMGSPQLDDGKFPIEHVDRIVKVRLDRIFGEANRKLLQLVEADRDFRPAPASLHPGFDASFKTTENVGSLQLSFKSTSNPLEIDADIDLYNDIRHAFEVFKNHFTALKTDPYDVFDVLRGSGLNLFYTIELN